MYTQTAFGDGIDLFVQHNLLAWIGHFDIHEDDVGYQRAGPLKCLAAGRRLAHDLFHSTVVGQVQEGSSGRHSNTFHSQVSKYRAGLPIERNLLELRDLPQLTVVEYEDRQAESVRYGGDQFHARHHESSITDDRDDRPARARVDPDAGVVRDRDVTGVERTVRAQLQRLTGLEVEKLAKAITEQYVAGSFLRELTTIA